MKEKRKLRPSKIKKSLLVTFGLVLIITALTVSISLTIADSSTPAFPFSNLSNKVPSPPPVNVAAPATQCKVNIDYAYVGPAPSYSSYQTAKGSMYLIDQYPSVVRLNFTRFSGAKMGSCDAEVEAYGIKIASNTGATEYHLFFIGTNYNPAFTNDSQSNLCNIYVNYLVNPSLYSTHSGMFIRNWTFDANAPASVISNTIGSIMTYANYPSNYTGLYSLGNPNSITVTVYRIGYITMSNDSFSLFKDPIDSSIGAKAPTNNVAAEVQLSNYESGFLQNVMIPTAKLPQIDLFHPRAIP